MKRIALVMALLLLVKPAYSQTTIRGMVGGGQAFSTYPGTPFSPPELQIYTATFHGTLREVPKFVIKHNDIMRVACTGMSSCYTDDMIYLQNKCPGTYQNPEAVPGYLCVYPMRMRNISDVKGVPNPFGFQLFCGTAMNSKMMTERRIDFIASWAYSPS